MEWLVFGVVGALVLAGLFVLYRYESRQVDDRAHRHGGPGGRPEAGPDRPPGHGGGTGGAG